MLDVVKLGEHAAVVRRAEGLELFERLTAEVAAVHKEQDAVAPGELDQPVDEVAGGEGLARRRWPSGSGRAGFLAAETLPDS